MTKTPIPENIRDMFTRFGKWKPTSLESLREACHRMLTACNDTLSMPKDNKFVSRLPGRIYVSNNGIGLDYYLALSAEGDMLKCLRLGKKNRIGERELTRVSLRPTGLVEKGFTADGPHSTERPPTELCTWRGITRTGCKPIWMRSGRRPRGRWLVEETRRRKPARWLLPLPPKIRNNA